MKDIVKEKQLKEVLYGLDYIANKAKSGKLELGVNNCKLLLEEIERLNNIINEIEKWLRNGYSKYNGAIRIANVLDKIKELKGSDKE